MEIRTNLFQTGPPPQEGETLTDYVKRNLPASQHETHLESVIECLSSHFVHSIPLDKIPIWLGMQKIVVKRTVLEKTKRDDHYIVSMLPADEITLTQRGFKMVCVHLGGGTRAESFVDFFMAVEDLVIQYEFSQLGRERDDLARFKRDSEQRDNDTRFRLEKYRIDVDAQTQMELQRYAIDVKDEQFYSQLKFDKEMTELTHAQEIRVLEHGRRPKHPQPLTVARWFADFLTPCETHSITIDDLISHFHKQTGTLLSCKDMKRELSLIGIKVPSVRFDRSGISKFRFKDIHDHVV